MLYGLAGKGVDIFANYRAIMAGAQASLMHLGIGPIVTGSIIMQLFVGAKIINLDLTKDDDKAVYQSTQKFVVIIMIFVESIPQVFGYLTPSTELTNSIDDAIGHGLFWSRTIIVTQLIIGSYLVFLMDEVVSKWGIGSGISLFIAAGVSQGIFTGTINWVPVNQTEDLSIRNPPTGTIPKTIYLYSNMSAGEFSRGGFETVFFEPPNPIIALIGTVVIFLIVAYVESCRLELPLAHGKARGARGRYPIKLIYASVIPVILMSALLANVSMFAMLFWSNEVFQDLPLVGRKWWVGYYPVVTDPETGMQTISTYPTAGAAWYLSPLNGVHDWLLPLVWPDKYGQYMYGHTWWQVIVHMLVYLGVMIIGCMLFARFWIETTNMGAKGVARQIERSGMHIPGFRRDPRILEKVLERYIPAVTIFSGAAVGALAAGADMIGTTGAVSGTGVLLAVSIMIQFYEAIGREQLMEMHPILREYFGR
jgi:preprotein translocase subunit SecY